ncbi:peptidylprolyl isomerase [Singulisphaera acidiphila]|uniref:peptidylprolyl isomerase n=1 Tax=Singulisphaera acidiphila (strain ATCC BAA-1392 / DSM 18658 / VKM B-2454 / MOB10) TaxID=886293 RepID=L0DP06_SINAD|nr:peptidylprolyl isomerase [Singulisphaera acidiphila]AGA30588.1 peptidyl-prolyl cis-trans isomerase (rotamase) - cyclophilin family [Singulisphaera acidiphila DSM 18658]
MFDRTWGGLFLGSRETRVGETRQAGRRHRPQLDSLEERQLLAASLAPLPDITVSANLGSQVSLDGSASGAAFQNYTVTSSNPDIPASVAVGKFLTLTVTHEKAADHPDDVLISDRPITYQLFDDLTPLTAGKIESFVQMNPPFYTGKNFHRVAGGFPTPTDYIIQGGSLSGTGSGFSGLAGNPFVDEFVQQLSFSNKYQLAMANSGPDTNDTQFFMTTGVPEFLNFKHTVFGQVVSGFSTVDDMTKVAVGGSDGTTPLSPILINSAALTTQNPNGVVHIDATKAKAGETSVITVTATDPATNTTATQTFNVKVGAPTQNSRAFIQQLPFPTQVVTTTPGTVAQPAVVYTQNVAENQKNIFQIPAVDPEGDKLTYIVKGGVSTSTGVQAFTDIPATQATATVDQNTGIVTVTPAQGFNGPINLLVGVRDQTNRSTSGEALDAPSNYSYHQIILNVSGATPVALTPIALPVTQTVAAASPTTIQLKGVSANPATSTGLTYAITTQPTHGTISQFDATKGTFVYTAAPNFSGLDGLQYTVTDHGTGTTDLTSPAAAVNLTITQAATGTVRQISNVLVVTPAPRTDRGTNIITISQINDATNAANDKIQVTINGVIDQTQPLVSDLDRIVVYGSKASDRITIDPNVDSFMRVTLDGGHGGVNVLQAGSGFTREHGWFGANTLKGGAGPNVLIGREGHVRFRPTATTAVMFAGKGHAPRKHQHTTPPTGTFFKSVNGRIVPVETPTARTNHQGGGNITAQRQLGQAQQRAAQRQSLLSRLSKKGGASNQV